MSAKKPPFDFSKYEVEGQREDGSLILRLKKVKPAPLPPAAAAGAPDPALAADMAALKEQVVDLARRVTAAEAHIADHALGRGARRGP